MIRHCVMLRLSAGQVSVELNAVLQGLAALVEELPGASGFAAGPNRDFEGKSPDFPFGFTIDFDTADALAAYATHPAHVALGGRLVALCEGGGDGIVVYDIETGPGSAD